MSIPTAGAVQATDDATAQAATPSTEQAQAATQTELSPAELRVELDRARKEAAKYRTDLRKFETAAEAKAAAELSEVERLRQELSSKDELLTAAQAKERDYALRDALTATLAAADFPATTALSPQRLLRLLDTDALTWGDDGQPQNIKALLTKLATDEPALFRAKERRPGPADAGGGGGQPLAGGGMNDLIRRAAGRQA
jgi:hypothetical protein